MTPQPPGRTGWAVRTLRRVGRAVLPDRVGVAWLATVLWMAGIWYLSSRPGRVGAFNWPRALAFNFGHAPLFGGLAICMAGLLPREDGWPRLDLRRSALVVAGCVAFGVVDELHQHLGSVRRDFSVLDLATDLVGAASVLWIGRYLARPDAGGRGLGARLLACLALSLAAAAVSTWLPRSFPGVGWL